MSSELRTLFTDLGPDISVIFDDRSMDTGTSNEYLQDESEDANIVNTKRVQTAASVDLLKFRSESRSQAIRRVAENALENRCKLAIGRILMDSMRDEYKAHASRPNGDVLEFMNHEHLTIEVLIQLLVGWAKANASKLGSLGKKMVSAVETIQETPGEQSSTSSPEQSEPDTESEN